MPKRSLQKITALLHTHNDAARIGRALDSLRPCDEVLVIDHGSRDRTVELARQHGAKVEQAVPSGAHDNYASLAQHDWIFCLLPSEALLEGLEAALLEWKQGRHKPSERFSVALQEETREGWHSLPATTRLVNRKQVKWSGNLPADDPGAQALDGTLQRFTNP
jgi:glycosyltransferase involved in cell wall biosynthesis